MVVQNLQQSQILAPTGQYLLQVICRLIELHLSEWCSALDKGKEVAAEFFTTRKHLIIDIIPYGKV